MKTNTKIAFTLVVSNGIIVLIFGAAIYYFLNKYSYIDFYKRLETRASIAARYNLDSDRLNSDALKNLREQHLERLPEEKEFLAPVKDLKDLSLTAQRFKLPLSFLEEIWNEGKAILKYNNAFYTGIRYNKAAEPYLVIVSAEHYYASHHLSFLRNIIIIGACFIVLLTLGLSFYFSKNIFAPIKKITNNVKSISTDSMHLRLAETENNTEISELTSTFNDLLNRLETAFETQKNFISNASHELGTPLTTIIGEADVALNKERKPVEYQEAIKKILEQAERLDQITKSLLFLAQTGYNGKKITFSIVRTDELIWGGIL